MCLPFCVVFCRLDFLMQTFSHAMSCAVNVKSGIPSDGAYSTGREFDTMTQSHRLITHIIHSFIHIVKFQVMVVHGAAVVIISVVLEMGK